MWHLFNGLLQLCANGSMDHYFHNVVVVMQNYLARAQDTILLVNFEGKNCVNMLLEFASYVKGKALDLGQAVYLMLLSTLLEFVKGLEVALPQIFDMIFDTYNKEKMPEVHAIVMQTFAVALYYNAAETCKVLEEKRITSQILQTFLQDCLNKMHQDYEVKKAVVGLCALL